MKWSEAIAKIDWNDPRQIEDWCDVSKLAQEMGFQSSYNFYGMELQSRVNKVWLHTWICTDTPVGAAAYFLDKELICVSWQNARKSDEYFYFASVEAHKKMLQFLRSLNDEVADAINIADLDKEIPE